MPTHEELTGEQDHLATARAEGGCPRGGGGRAARENQGQTRGRGGQVAGTHHGGLPHRWVGAPACRALPQAGVCGAGQSGRRVPMAAANRWIRSGCGASHTVLPATGGVRPSARCTTVPVSACESSSSS